MAAFSCLQTNASCPPIPSYPILTNPNYMRNLRIIAQKNISRATTLSVQAKELASLLRAQGKDTSSCEKEMAEAEKLLENAKSLLGNPIAANNGALKAIEKFRRAMDCFKAISG